MVFKYLPAIQNLITTAFFDWPLHFSFKHLEEKNAHMLKVKNDHTQ